MSDATVVIKGRNDLGLAVKQAEAQLRGLLKQGELVGKFFRGGAIGIAILAFERLAENAEKAAEKIGDKGTARALRELNREIDSLKSKGLNLIGKALGETFALAGQAGEFAKINAEISRLEAHLNSLDSVGLGVGRDRLVEEIRLLKERRDLYAKALPAGERSRAPGGQGGRGRNVSVPVDIETSAERRSRIQAEMARLFPDIAVTATQITVSATEQMYRAMDDATKTSIQKQVDEWVAFEATIADLLANGRISPEDASARLAENVAAQFEDIEVTARHIEEKYTQINEYALEAARGMQRAFADFLFDPFKDGLDGMLAGFITTIQRMVAEAAAAEILTTFFSWAGGALTGAGFAGAGSFVSKLGTRASGGPVSGGTPYMVGERGPEMFIPGTSGQIVPNGALGGISLSYNIDARGADAERIMAIMPGLLKQSSDQTVARVRDLVGRGKLV
jgi:hypothetical protein